MVLEHGTTYNTVRWGHPGAQWATWEESAPEPGAANAPPPQKTRRHRRPRPRRGQAFQEQQAKRQAYLAATGTSKEAYLAAKEAYLAAKGSSGSKDSPVTPTGNTGKPDFRPPSGSQGQASSSHCYGYGEISASQKGAPAQEAGPYIPRLQRLEPLLPDTPKPPPRDIHPKAKERGYGPGSWTAQDGQWVWVPRR